MRARIAQRIRGFRLRSKMFDPGRVVAALRPLRGREILSVPQTGGARRDHRLIAAIPSGCGKGRHQRPALPAACRLG